jgi:hypothetical protein
MLLEGEVWICPRNTQKARKEEEAYESPESTRMMGSRAADGFANE